MNSPSVCSNRSARRTADLQVQIETIGDAIVHEEILRDGLPR